MTYRITFKNHLSALKTTFFCTILFFGVGYFVYNKEGFGINTDTVPYFLIYYVVSIIPALFLHVEYYLINRKDIVIINALKETISFNDQKVVYFKNIVKITLVMSPVLYRKGSLGFTPFDNYHYAIIMMNGGEEFIFTCLLAKKVEETMKQITDVPIEKRRRFIPSTLMR